ncbi:pseudouridine synthase [Nitzschia inconspicua]|uniref:Pseudouridine synthase n=1 Tax=Nitzschia inconspicua TaxID=303405 RepID=A0A9K3KE22_9STRA|nr:pseudouridine synthase [Nitzschia inconspicua]
MRASDVYLAMSDVGQPSTTIRNVTKCDRREQERPTNSLSCPGAFASFPFRAKGLQVSYHETDAQSSTATGCILPLQRYHIKNVKDDPNPIDARSFSKQDVLSIPNLDFVVKNLDKLNLSVSSKAMLQKYQEEEQIKANHISNGDRMNPSLLLNKIRTELQASQPLSTDILQILYCDDHICVVNKPSGVLSVPGARRNPSLANLVHDTLKPPIDVDQTVVHRLDMATSGILVFALSLEALLQLHGDFKKERRVYKIYQCLVEGHLPTTSSLEGEIDVALERDHNNPPFMRIAQERNNDNDGLENREGTSINLQHKFWREPPKPSLTEYRILGHETRFGRPITRLEMKPLTGRTHQLRVHTAQVLGSPIIGDDIYGCDTLKDYGPERQLCLHAQKLCIYHPFSGAPMLFEADAPF